MQYDNEIIMQPTADQYINRQSQTYQAPVISKSSKQMKDLSSDQGKTNVTASTLRSTAFSKSLDTVYTNFSISNIGSDMSLDDPLRSKYN